MLRGILFDLDGTLTHTDSLHFKTWQDLLKDYDLPLDREFYDVHFSGRLNADIINDVLPHLSADEVQQLGDRKEEEFRRRAKSLLQPLPGVLNVLNWVQANKLKYGVVTNAPASNAYFMLEVLKLDSIFQTVVIGEDLTYGKPHPMPYRVGLEKLGILPEESLAFEDSPSGIRSAVAAGILTVGIASTHDPQMLYDQGATLVASDFTDNQLLQFLDARC